MLYTRENTVVLKWDLSNLGEDFLWKESSLPENTFTSHESVTKDAHMLIFTFLLRSNHISKTIKNSLPGVKEILEMLKYDINDEVRVSESTLGAVAHQTHSTELYYFILKFRL